MSIRRVGQAARSGDQAPGTSAAGPALHIPVTSLFLWLLAAGIVMFAVAMATNAAATLFTTVKADAASGVETALKSLLSASGTSLEQREQLISLALLPAYLSTTFYLVMVLIFAGLIHWTFSLVRFFLQLLADWHREIACGP